jgi:hypothetical protein
MNAGPKNKGKEDEAKKKKMKKGGGGQGQQPPAGDYMLNFSSVRY